MKISMIIAGLTTCLSIVFASPIGEISLDKRAVRGSITAPAANTAIAPGQTFAFSYSSHSDYCLTSRNFTVWLWTSPPADVFQNLIDGRATGHFFGRYSIQTYTFGVPDNVPNLVPSTLTMPDFSRSPGRGFGQGARASNLLVYLGVIEEFNTCDPTIGNSLSLAYVPLIYNATSQ